MRQVDRANVQREIQAMETRRVQDTLNALRRAYDELKAQHAQRESGLNGLIADQQLRLQEATENAEQREQNLENQLVESQANLQQARSITSQMEVLDGVGVDFETLETLKTDLTAFEGVLLEREQRMKMAEAQQRKADSAAQITEQEIRAALGGNASAGKWTLAREGSEVTLTLATDWIYDANTSAFNQAGADVVTSLAQYLLKHPNLLLRIEGHTDNSPVTSGLGADSWELGFVYAKSLAKTLIEDLKVNPMAIQVNSYGFYRPVAMNTTPEGKAANRRLELHFIQK